MKGYLSGAVFCPYPDYDNIHTQLKGLVMLQLKITRSRMCCSYHLELIMALLWRELHYSVHIENTFAVDHILSISIKTKVDISLRNCMLLCSYILSGSQDHDFCCCLHFKNRILLMRYGASMLWHLSLPLMSSFIKTAAAIFHCRLCFLRAFPFTRCTVSGWHICI